MISDQQRQQELGEAQPRVDVVADEPLDRALVTRRQVALVARAQTLPHLARSARARSLPRRPSLRGARARARAAASASLRVGVGRPLPPSLAGGASARVAVSSDLVRRNNGLGLSASDAGRWEVWSAPWCEAQPTGADVRADLPRLPVLTVGWTTTTAVACRPRPPDTEEGARPP